MRLSVKRDTGHNVKRAKKTEVIKYHPYLESSQSLPGKEKKK